MQKEQYVLSIDQGTTGTKVLLVDRQGSIRAQSYRKHTQYYPRSGWAEHDPEEIWQMVLAAIDDSLRKGKVQPEQVAAVGVANQGETVMIWDVVDSKPLYPAIVWSCRRSADIAERWGQDSDWAQRINVKTGLRIDSYFSATKLRWIMESLPYVKEKLERGEACCGTLDSWLIWNMTGRRAFVTDPSTAARTLLFNIRTREWDEEILHYLDIRREWLAQVLPTVGQFGETSPEHFLGIRAPITVSLVDQPAALYGHLCVEPGMSKCTYGTGCFAYLHAGAQPLAGASDELLSTIVWQRDKEIAYALDGAIYSAGSAIEWGMNMLGLYTSIAQLQEWSEQWLTNGYMRTASSSQGVLFVPSLSGLGAPHWNSNVRGTFLGLSQGTGKAELARAILEGIAHRVADVLDTMQQVSGQTLKSLRVDGGLTKNPYLMQFQADILGIPVEVPEQTETTALGVAYLLGESVGWWHQRDLQKRMAIAKRYEPKLPAENRAELRACWQKAVRLLQQFHA